MASIGAEQQGLEQEMRVLSPGHNIDPIGGAKQIHVTLTEKDGNSGDERKNEGIMNRFGKLKGSFAAEIRTSGDTTTSSPPDFIMKGTSDDLEGGEAQVSVTDKSGKVVMTMSRATRHTFLMIGNENATIQFPSRSGTSGSFSGKGRALTFNEVDYTFNITNKCTQCYYICASFMCFIPTLGIGSCILLNKMTKLKSTAEFKVQNKKIGDFDVWFCAAPFKPDDVDGSACCGKPERFDTLLTVDVSDASTWTADRKWAMFAMAVATAMDTQLERPNSNTGGGGGD